VPTGKLSDTPSMRGDSPEPDPPHEQALAEKIRLLQQDRDRHARAIEEIDQVLERIQRALAALQGGGMDWGHSFAAASDAAAGLPRPRRRYQKLALTGEESVLAFVRQHGRPTTAEINDHWKSEGRPGVANPTVARLLKRGLLQREEDPAVRGSRYRVTN
jgi:hypothetical protein